MTMDLATRSRVMLFIESRRLYERIEAGNKGGGQFRGPATQIIALLKDWMNGKGSDDPIGDLFKDVKDPKQRRDKLRDAVAQMRKKALAAGDEEQAARLVPRRGADENELKLLLYQDAKASARGRRDAAEKPSAKFTLQGAKHHDLDVAVFKDADGRPRLFKTNDRNEQLGLVEKFNNLAELQSWAKANGETRLAAWAGRERKKLPEGGALDLHTPAEVANLAKGLDMTVPQSHVVVKAEGRRRIEAVLDDIDRMVADGGSNKALLVTLREHRDAGAPKAVTDELTAAVESGDKSRVRALSAGIRARLDETPAPAKAPAKPGLSAADHAQVAKIASAFHEDWRKTRLQPDGSYEPRVKKTKDQAWIDAHGTDEVDIANTTYGDLPDDWKAENKAAAEVVAGILQRHGGKVDLSDEKTRSQVGEEIHQAWLSRNPWAAGGDLDVPFKDLPADEQAKDIDQLKVAMGVSAPEVSVKAPRVRKTTPEGDGLPSRAEVAKAPSRKVGDLKEGDRLYVFLGRYGAQAKAPEAGTHGLDPDPRRATIAQIKPDGRIYIRTDAGYEGELLGSGGGFLRPNRDTVRIAPPRPGGAPGDGGAPVRKATPAAKSISSPATPAKRAPRAAAPKSLMAQMTPDQRQVAREFGLPDNHPLADLAHRIDEAPTRAEAERLVADVHPDDLNQVAKELGIKLQPKMTADEKKAEIVQQAMVFGNAGGMDVRPPSVPSGTPAKKAGRAPEGFDVSQLEGLTVRQKRARLRAMGFSPEQIDELAPTAAMAKKASRSEDFDEDDLFRAEDLEDDADEELDDESVDAEPVDEIDLALEHYQPLDAAARSRALAMRAVGHDVTPGHDRLHHYWVAGPGLARWVGSPKPWTTLLANLREEVKDKPLETLKRWASAWFLQVFHFAAGSDMNRVTHGHPPRGHRVGPG